MSELKSISPTRAAELVRKGAVLIDIREADERARERIPGARHHALSRIDAESPVRADDDVLVFHCRSGARTKGNAARLSAVSQNCETYILEGGLDAWKKAGLPVALDRSSADRYHTAGPNCRRQPGAAGRGARRIGRTWLLRIVRLCRRRSAVCRHHRLLRHGAISRFDALESAHASHRAMMLIHDLLAVASGGVVGFVLGLVGGGGSILAVPLLISMRSPSPFPVIAVGLYVVVRSLSVS